MASTRPLRHRPVLLGRRSAKRKHARVLGTSTTEFGCPFSPGKEVNRGVPSSPGADPHPKQNKNPWFGAGPFGFPCCTRVRSVRTRILRAPFWGPGVHASLPRPRRHRLRGRNPSIERAPIQAKAHRVRSPSEATYPGVASNGYTLHGMKGPLNPYSCEKPHPDRFTLSPLGSCHEPVNRTVCGRTPDSSQDRSEPKRRKRRKRTPTGKPIRSILMMLGIVNTAADTVAKLLVNPKSWHHSNCEQFHVQKEITDHKEIMRSDAQNMSTSSK